MPSPQERREEYRLAVGVPARLQMLGASGGTGPELALRLVELSAGGCRIVDPPRLLRPGTRWRAALELPDGEPPLRLVLEVLGRRPGPTPTWGCRFLEVGEEEQARIRRYLYRVYAASRQRGRASEPSLS
jgi:c-di-GMP-binding flagellar brake protein YcgR